MDVETTTAGGVAVAAISGAAGWLSARLKTRAKERAALAKEREAEAGVERSRVIAGERVEVAQINADVSISRTLLDRMAAVEAAAERCHAERRADKMQHSADRAADAAQRRKDREGCEQKIAALRHRLDHTESDLGTVAGRTAETRAALLRMSRPDSEPPAAEGWDDDTGLHELEAIRTRTPTEPLRPVAPRRRTRAERAAVKTGGDET